MVDIEQRDNNIDSQMEIKIEHEEHEIGISGYENANATPSNADVDASSQLWTSKATACLIKLFKKYRPMVGQTTQIRSLREMFQVISQQMQNYGFYFSQQKCENKWRVLERKYKNYTFRERLKKTTRRRYYGYFEHKRALDEIFNEYIYMKENDGVTVPSTRSAACTPTSPKPSCDQGNDSVGGREQEDSLAMNNEKDEAIHKQTLPVMFEKIIEEIRNNFTWAERNKEKRHQEKMAVKQKELELKRQLLKLKKQKVELQKSQLIAAAQNLRLTIK